MKNAIISAEKLNLIFETVDDDVVALKDVSLNIDKGEFVSFIGPSGCGKTTFLRAIASLEKPTSGNLTVNGLSPEDARKNRAYGFCSISYFFNTVFIKFNWIKISNFFNIHS